MDYALEGLRVLDLSRLLPGPFASMILADMGAEVMRIDDPVGARGWPPTVPPPAGFDRDEKGAAYNPFARNKRSIILNLKDETARHVFYKLSSKADVVLVEFRPGVADRLGVDYDTLRRMNPRIVYCAISGFGQDGPYRDLAGHDANFCSIAGVTGLTGDHEGNPVINRIPLADISAGLHAVIGILCAIVARQKTGLGQFVDISMTDCVMSWAAGYLTRYLRDGMVPDRRWLSPAFDAWPTSDGKFVVNATAETHFWERFCAALGRHDLIPHRRPSASKRKEIHGAVRQEILTRTRDEWVRVMRQADTCLSPVLELDEVALDPQLQHRKMIIELNHPIFGKVRQFGFPIKLSETPAGFRNFAPLLGQDTNDILLEEGYSREDIRRLRQRAAVG